MWPDRRLDPAGAVIGLPKRWVSVSRRSRVWRQLGLQPHRSRSNMAVTIRPLKRRLPLLTPEFEFLSAPKMKRGRRFDWLYERNVATGRLESVFSKNLDLPDNCAETGDGARY